MRIIMVALVICLSCKGLIKQPIIIAEPPIHRLANYSTRSFDESFFNEDHYGAYKMRDSVEHLQLFTAEIIVIRDTTKFYLTNCEALLNSNELTLKFSAYPFSDEWIALEIKDTGHTFKVEYYDVVMTLDSAAKPTLYTPLTQKILLEKNSYEKGDLLKGKIALSVLRCARRSKEEYCDTVKIYGLIKTTIK